MAVGDFINSFKFLDYKNNRIQQCGKDVRGMYTDLKCCHLPL